MGACSKISSDRYSSLDHLYKRHAELSTPHPKATLNFFAMTKLAAIFGAGQRVGKSVALQFLHEGYQVAVVSRSGTKSLDEEAEKFKGALRRYSADLGSAEDAVRVWKEIKKDFSTPISVVFYNGEADVDLASHLT